ncbi:unnamed protein product [Cuscuta epithymum]|uniref:Uncharacterized protein n=1 Tax=Cuscuta epithymum TaxID=186058 RepID=A0AAV0DVM5_9ASTE|nr:unnamed protein product [Cuscuta epithymum]
MMEECMPTVKYNSHICGVYFFWLKTCKLQSFFVVSIQIEFQPVGKGSPPIDQEASHTCVNPLSGEDEAVGEGTHPLDHGPSYTGVNTLSQECHTLTNLMLCSSEFGADKFDEISEKAPFENLDWAEVDEEGGSATIDVLVLEEQSRKANLKRKRKCSEYRCSPFTDPTRKRAKGQNTDPSPTFVDICDDEWLQLKKWVEEDDNLEPTVVVIAITGYNQGSHKFFRDLIEPEEWLSSEHIGAICSLIHKSMVNKKIGPISPYFTLLSTGQKTCYFHELIGQVLKRS